MSKKMKKVDLGPSPPYGGVYEDAKARLKHQTLLQDFQDLQKEADDMKNNLDNAKRRKMILLAEVRFLRQRYKYLIKTKSLNCPQEQLPNVQKKRKLSTNDRISRKTETAQFKLPPLPDVKHKGRVYAGMEGAVRNMTSALDLNRKLTSHSGKEAAVRSSTPVSDLNYRKRICGGMGAAVRNAEPAINLKQNEKLQGGNVSGLGSRTPTFDLNQDTTLGGKEATFPSRAPVFDLNEISTEEEQANYYEQLKFEEPKKGLIRAGNEEQPNDLKLSICRNGGEGSSRIGKRKISWQDPVALRV